MGKTITVPAAEIPVIGEVDVLVAGGGPAGFASAVAAARAGADTLLIEATASLGGQATGGLVGPFMPTAGEEGVYNEMRERVRAMGGLKNERAFDAEIVKYVMQLMVEEAGARQLLFTVTEDALRDGDLLSGAIVVNKAGRGAIRARVVIDCTGDGDIAWRAGAAFDKGREDGHLQASTLWLEVGGVDEEAFAKGLEEYKKNVKGYADAERKAGRLHMPEYALVRLIWKGSTLEPGHYSVNSDTAVEIDGTDPWALTRGTNESRKRVFEIAEFFRRYLPGAEKCFVAKTGTIYGVRETRRFRGLASVSGQDVIDGRKREDGICRASFFLDLHDGKDNWAEKKYPTLRVKKGDWYEIPYGCLVPEKVDGLLLAGRNISSDRPANGSLRVMPTCMATGQAAGVAAALCARERMQPRELPASRVQQILRERYGVTMAHEAAVAT